MDSMMHFTQEALDDGRKLARTTMTTEEIRDKLRERYAPPEWVFLEEVAPRTGGGTRYADAVAVNLWRSRGYQILGFEIKMSRSDWLHELKQPNKSDPVYQYCDGWYVVAPKGLIKESELPNTWGLMEVTQNRIGTTKKADKLSPIPVTREFFASLIRRSHEQLEQLSERKQRLAVQKARAEIDDRINKETEQRSKRFLDLSDSVKKFEQETGIKITTFSVDGAVDQFKLAMLLSRLGSFNKENPFSDITRMAERLEEAARRILSEAVGQSIEIALATKICISEYETATAKDGDEQC